MQVARPIRDDLVMAKTANMGAEGVYYMSNPAYEGNVTDSLKKVKIAPTEFGIIKLRTTSSLEKLYASITVNSENCIVEYISNAGIHSEFAMSVKEFRMLKALAFEQVNVNEEYSSVVAGIFMQLLGSILKKTHRPEWIAPKECSKMQSVVYRDITSFISHELGLDMNKDEQLKLEVSK